jgi:uncharacterized membrane protein YqjE
MIERLVALASIAVRHAGAYTDLILSDIDATRSMLHRRLVAGTVVVGSSVLAAALGCVWIIALTWDTPARIWAIAALLVVFLAVAAVSLWKLTTLRAREPPMLSRTAREWAKDRQLLEELLARERADSP